ncbi:MAG: hypothetical protein Q8R08_00535 [bacterium]|nr:hypothetical protein [bacterium]
MSETPTPSPEQRGERISAFYKGKQETQERFEGLLQEFRDLHLNYGDQGVAAAHRLYSAFLEGDEERAKGILKDTASLPNLAKAGEASFQYLVDQRIVEELPSKSVILDTEKLKMLAVYNSPQRALFGHGQGAQSKLNQIYYALRGRTGVSRLGHEKGDYKAKPILYVPENEKEAYSIDAIKKSEFVSPIWELGTYGSSSFKHPTKNGRSVNFDAVRIAAMIYHPRYGDAYRDENGRLMIRDPKQNKEFRPINVEILRSSFGLSHPGLQTDIGEILRTRVPELLENDLLRQSDFRVQTGNRFESSRPLRKDTISHKGIVIINGVLHFLGTQFYNPNYEFVKLDPTTGGALKKDKKGLHISHTFRVFSPSPELMENKKQPYAGKELTQVSEFDETSLIPRREGESPDEYSTRTAPLRDMDFFLEFSNEFYRATGINPQTLPLQEQVSLASAVYDSLERRAQFFSFVKQYGPENLKVFVACSQNPDYFQTIMDLTDKLGQNLELTKKIFAAYGANIDGLSKKTDEIIATYKIIHADSALQPNTVLDALMARANALLVQAADEIKNAPADQREEIVVRLIQNFQEQEKIFEQTFKDFDLAARTLADIPAAGSQGKQYFRLKVAFEQKCQDLVSGKVEAKLDQNFGTSVNRAVLETKPEQLPKREPLYFPVGISKEMPKWQEVLDGKLNVAKPIDMYTYLFWLQNQGKPVTLMVCDEIQTSNYQELYGASEGEARQVALAIGQKEIENYRKIIETFGLNNITVVDYQTFKRDTGEEKIEHYRTLSAELAKNPILQEAFLAMFQESVAGEEGDKEKFLAYALEEVSWILARGGTKIGHRIEARYDVVAAFIKNMEALASREGLNLTSIPNDPRLLPVINEVARGLTSFVSRGLQSAKSEEQKEYYGFASQSLKLINRNLLKRRGDVALTVPKFESRYDFVCPAITSQSFGWRQAGSKQEGKVNFKEPYSTYFYHEGAEIFLNSDQVVAVPDGQIAGKVLALNPSKQREYANSVLKPMLVEYFRCLKTAPQSYFETVGKDRAELLAEMQNSQTVIDLLKFVQQYVVKPAAA